MNEPVIFYHVNHLNEMNHDAWVNQELEALTNHNGPRLIMV